MIIELSNNDEVKINELNNTFNYVLNDIKKDIDINPFSKYIVYLIDNKIVGYLNYYLMYERLEIANFNVLESFQNKGIGTKLLEYLINKYKCMVDNITLEVRCDNLKAIRLYQKFGFKEKAKRIGYYQGIDGILMERSMK